MVQVIIKAFDILELVSKRNGQAVSLTEVSTELGLNQSTTANIMNTLVYKNYLEHLGKKRGYKLGAMAFQLTNSVAYEKDLVQAAKGVMEDLTLSLNESCVLGVMKNYKRLILHSVNSTQDIQVQIRSEKNVYETASGRLLLSSLSMKELDRFLGYHGLPKEHLWPEATNKEELYEQLKIIKEKGIAETKFSHNHLMGFAVPIILNNQVIAGISVFLPEYRCTPEKQEMVIHHLNNAALLISKKLSIYQPG
ncbi:IclR family transcriptional regulator C-terminal domain-containing protein [uncultured Arcticibacterium sp.]|uniref:IclR family transcriptional regulator n=1 Tax=uncultured Arcticibacterium sp. TaxID=2173042 RepID=UPI0030FA108A